MRVVGTITATASGLLPAGRVGELARFAVVGLSNTALSWSLYALGVHLGVAYPVAAAGSFAAGAVNGYTLNRVWTFRSGRFSASMLARYAGIQVAALAVNLVLLVGLVEVVGMHRLSAQLVALTAVALMGYAASRRWAFAPAGTAGTAGAGRRRSSLPWGVLAKVIANLGVAGTVAGSVIAVIIVSAKQSYLSPPSRAGFPVWLAGPWHQLGVSVPQQSWALFELFATVVGAMLAVYVLVAALAARLSAPVVVSAIVLLHVVFLLAPPFPLTDIFNYLGYARLGVLHHLNPVTHMPIEAKQDAAYRMATWHHLPTPYGPLFTAGSYGLVPLGIVKGYWAIKGLTTLASLGCLMLVWKCARALDRPPVPALAFVAFNPLLLVYGLGGFHNDFFMLLPVLGGALLVLKGRSALGGAAATTAVFIKVVAGVFVPFVLLGARRRPVAIAAAVATAGLLAATAAATFGTRYPGLTDQASQVVGAYSIPSELGLIFGFGIDATSRAVVAVVLVAAIVILLIRTWRGAHWIETAGWAALALAAAQVQPMPWYIVWALPFAALGRSRSLRIATVALGLILVANSPPVQTIIFSHTLHVQGAVGPSRHVTRSLLH
ncbi:MAG: alpha,6-mannosyltransferase [Thermoleophilaceae bacterium]|nr:alpha,6-mannosyltransferase [Thermoleophilaceae bacterium]